MKSAVVTFLAIAFVAGAASASAGSALAEPGKSGTYWWLHPKLGMVKVDRATNAMVTSKRKDRLPSETAPVGTNR